MIIILLGAPSTTESGGSHLVAARVKLREYFISHMPEASLLSREWCPRKREADGDHTPTTESSSLSFGASLHQAALTATVASVTEYLMTLVVEDRHLAVNAQDANGNTPFALALFNGKYAMCTKLLELGADPNYSLSPIIHRRPPLFHLVCIGAKYTKQQTEVVRLVCVLCNSGVDRTARDPETKRTALHHACHHNLIHFVRALTAIPSSDDFRFKVGLNLPVGDGSGDTPLMTAVRAHASSCVVCLIEAGAITSVRNTKGESVLDVALAVGASSIIVRLLEQCDKL